METSIQLSPTEFISVVNQTLEYAYSSVLLVGEVASFKVNQGKWVFFDIKDDESSISCFMTVYQLRIPLEDGMKVVVRGVPKLTKWGRFSFTVNSVMPVGEGSIKKAYEFLKKKLTSEGLFDAAKKRGIPEDLSRIGVISSTAAAGYADFIKILNERWCGLDVQVAHTQVQGVDAPDQIIRALRYFNEQGEVQIIAILRGGGSADDLACFNDETLVREIAASRIPVITGIGHEVDESLADLAADIKASTPSNVAQMLTPDKSSVKQKVGIEIQRAGSIIKEKIDSLSNEENEKILRVSDAIRTKITERERWLIERTKLLSAMSPEQVLKRGYAILRGEVAIGNNINIVMAEKEIKALVKEINER